MANVAIRISKMAISLTLNNVEVNNSYSYGAHIRGCGYRLTHSNVTFNNNADGNVYDQCVDYPGVVRPDLP